MKRFLDEAIKNKGLTEASVYEQLAEECNELAHASLKMARILRGENPTPVEIEEATKMVDEELADVVVVAEGLERHVDMTVFKYKLNRWAQRLGVSLS